MKSSDLNMESSGLNMNRLNGEFERNLRSLLLFEEYPLQQACIKHMSAAVYVLLSRVDILKVQHVFVEALHTVVIGIERHQPFGRP
jgi:hypothetical protein